MYLCVCVCYDGLVDEAIGSLDAEPTKTTEELTDDKKAVKEEKDLEEGTSALTVSHVMIFDALLDGRQTSLPPVIADFIEAF